MRIIFIVGPTASGKTKISIELANRINAEIIIADSRGIYREMPTVTATPTHEERRGIKHHLVSFLEFTDSYSSSQFTADAMKIIDDLSLISKNVVIVGGSGNYVDALFFSAHFRSKLRQLSSETSHEVLLGKINKLYPSLQLNNSDCGNFRRLKKIYEYGPSQFTKTAPRYPSSEIYGINPDLSSGPIAEKNQPRLREIRKNIETRLEKMFDSGLEMELQNIIKTPAGREVLAVTTIGSSYFKYLRGELSFAETKDAIILENYHLAKKQLTWFKRNPYIKWFQDYDDFFYNIS